MRMQHETFVIRMKLNEMTGEVISDINVAIVALTIYLLGISTLHKLDWLTAADLYCLGLRLFSFESFSLSFSLSLGHVFTAVLIWVDSGQEMKDSTVTNEVCAVLT